MNTKKENLLKAHQIQSIQIEDGVILRKGSLSTFIKGKNEVEITEQIISSITEEAKSMEELLSVFPEIYHEKIEKFILGLVEKNILFWTDVSGNFNSFEKSNESIDLKSENFFWNFKKNAKEVQDTFSLNKLAIVGINLISKRLVSSLLEMGFKNFFLVDDPELRNLSLFKEDGSIDFSGWPVENYQVIKLEKSDVIESWSSVEKPNCLIATTDIGAIQSIRKLHQFSFINNIHFLPITLQDNIGQVGPLTLPKQNVCYECLLSRLNSNFESYELMRKVEELAGQGQHVVGFLPPMANVIADFAAMELSKFYGKWFPTHLLNSYIEVNLVDTRVVCHHILKIPRCSVCSPTNTCSTATHEYAPRIPALSLDIVAKNLL